MFIKTVFLSHYEPPQTADFRSTDSLVDFSISMKMYGDAHIITIRYRPKNKPKAHPIKLSDGQKFYSLRSFLWLVKWLSIHQYSLET